MGGKRKTPQVAAIGEVVFDILTDCRKLGGAPTDFLKYAVKHGAKASLISAIGADDLGREVVSELNKFKINPVLAVTPYPTGRELILKNTGKNYTIHILENAAWDYIPFTTAAEKCIATTDAIFFGTLALRKSYSRNTILDLIDQTPDEAYKFFDVNLRQNYYDKSLIEELLKRANVLKLNHEELKTVKDLLDLRGASENLCKKLKDKFNLKYLILTDAAKESTIFGEDEISKVTNMRVHQAFAYGAGNAFGGAFIADILCGKTLKEAHESANQAAIEICQANYKNR